MEDKWKKLKDSLELEEYPLLYYFKFIIPNEEEKLNHLKSKFSAEGADISLNYSKSEKYVSVRIKEVMMSAQQIIDAYISVGEIEGVISL
ncbi:MAG: DUF493 family protein [Crocinitomicaceae bacterium]|nr:DUF493 family protein [Crocinitomicaceae bacterium]